MAWIDNSTMLCFGVVPRLAGGTRYAAGNTVVVSATGSWAVLVAQQGAHAVVRVVAGAELPVRLCAVGQA